MPPAARVTDMHTCPMVTPGVPPIPHVGGPILPPCSPTVLIDFLPAARVTDMATCVGPPDSIAMGSAGVFINYLPAARVGDPTVHGGVIVMGSPTCIIGELGSGGGGGPAGLSSILHGLYVALSAVGVFLGFPGAAKLSGNEKLDSIVEAVNPSNSTVNCGNIIDAVNSRLNGSDPDATAPAAGDGSFGDIEKRFNTKLSWGHSFQDAFASVQDGGDGTTAVVGIVYSGGTSSHVLIMTNNNGTVGIIEAQNWGSDNPKEVITNSDRANQRYNSDGGSNIGYGILPKN